MVPRERKEYRVLSLADFRRAMNEAFEAGPLNLGALHELASTDAVNCRMKQGDANAWHKLLVVTAEHLKAYTEAAEAKGIDFEIFEYFDEMSEADLVDQPEQAGYAEAVAARMCEKIMLSLLIGKAFVTPGKILNAMLDVLKVLPPKAEETYYWPLGEIVVLPSAAAQKKAWSLVDHLLEKVGEAGNDKTFWIELVSTIADRGGTNAAAIELFHRAIQYPAGRKTLIRDIGRFELDPSCFKRVGEMRAELIEHTTFVLGIAEEGDIDPEELSQDAAIELVRLATFLWSLGADDAEAIALQDQIASLEHEYIQMWRQYRLPPHNQK